MESENLSTDIQSNLIDYLFVGVPCPKCNQTGALSLRMIHNKQWVLCPNCRSKIAIAVPGENLKEFAESFDQLYAQLRKFGLSLAFFHNPVATIWSRDDKP